MHSAPCRQVRISTADQLNHLVDKIIKFASLLEWILLLKWQRLFFNIALLGHRLKMFTVRQSFCDLLINSGSDAVSVHSTSYRLQISSPLATECFHMDYIQDTHCILLWIKKCCLNVNVNLNVKRDNVLAMPYMHFGLKHFYCHFCQNVNIWQLC